jgi:hypothetical protein
MMSGRGGSDKGVDKHLVPARQGGGGVLEEQFDAVLAKVQRTFATACGAHLPPRAVPMPRPLSAAPQHSDLSEDD